MGLFSWKKSSAKKAEIPPAAASASSSSSARAQPQQQQQQQQQQLRQQQQHQQQRPAQRPPIPAQSHGAVAGRAATPAASAPTLSSNTGPSVEAIERRLEQVRVDTLQPVGEMLNNEPSVDMAPMVDMFLGEARSAMEELQAGAEVCMEADRFDLVESLSNLVGDIEDYGQRFELWKQHAAAAQEAEVQAATRHAAAAAVEPEPLPPAAHLSVATNNPDCEMHLDLQADGQTSSARANSAGVEPLDSSSGRQLTPGMRIRVVGLQKQKDLNGKAGKLNEFLSEEARWGVILDGGFTLSLKPVNVEPLSPVAFSASSSDSNDTYDVDVDAVPPPTLTKTDPALLKARQEAEEETRKAEEDIQRRKAEEEAACLAAEEEAQWQAMEEERLRAEEEDEDRRRAAEEEAEAVRSALEQLEQHRATLVHLQSQVDGLDASFRSGDESPGKDRDDLAQLEAQLEKLQCKGIDSVETLGLEGPAALRKQLTKTAEVLHQRILSIFDDMKQEVARLRAAALESERVVEEARRLEELEAARKAEAEERRRAEEAEVRRQRAELESKQFAEEQAAKKRAEEQAEEEARRVEQQLQRRLAEEEEQRKREEELQRLHAEEELRLREQQEAAAKQLAEEEQEEEERRRDAERRAHEEKQRLREEQEAAAKQLEEQDDQWRVTERQWSNEQWLGEDAERQEREQAECKEKADAERRAREASAAELQARKDAERKERELVESRERDERERRSQEQAEMELREDALRKKEAEAAETDRQAREDAAMLEDTSKAFRAEQNQRDDVPEPSRRQRKVDAATKRGESLPRQDASWLQEDRLVSNEWLGQAGQGLEWPEKEKTSGRRRRRSASGSSWPESTAWPDAPLSTQQVEWPDIGSSGGVQPWNLEQATTSFPLVQGAPTSNPKDSDVAFGWPSFDKTENAPAWTLCADAPQVPTFEHERDADAKKTIENDKVLQPARVSEAPTPQSSARKGGRHVDKVMIEGEYPGRGTDKVSREEVAAQDKVPANWRLLDPASARNHAEHISQRYAQRQASRQCTKDAKQLEKRVAKEQASNLRASRETASDAKSPGSGTAAVKVARLSPSKGGVWETVDRLFEREFPSQRAEHLSRSHAQKECLPATTVTQDVAALPTPGRSSSVSAHCSTRASGNKLDVNAKTAVVPPAGKEIVDRSDVRPHQTVVQLRSGGEVARPQAATMHIRRPYCDVVRDVDAFAAQFTRAAAAAAGVPPSRIRVLAVRPGSTPICPEGV